MPALVLMLWVLLFATPVAAGDEECLACHGEKDMKSAAGRSISVDPARHKASVHGALGCTTCHTNIKEFPHPARPVVQNCAACHADAAEQTAKSIHGRAFRQAGGMQACMNCHGDIHVMSRAAVRTGGECATCHADTVREYQGSVHAASRRNGDKDSPLCFNCHGAAHTLVSHKDPASPVAKQKLARTCGACHANPDFLARHQIDFAQPVEAYERSTHGRALAAGNSAAPSCSDCHSSHAIYRASDARSKINHFSVPSTCGQCHREIKVVFVQSVHGQASARGVRNSPVCTDCHGEHSILAPSEPGSLVNPARVSTVTCGHCHADERLMERYNLPADKVPTFRDSFHGLSSRAGRQTVANCASCHGVHNILPSSDPRSMIHADNLAATCGSCHPGAGARYAIGPVHVKSDTESEHAVVRFIRVSYWVLIPLTVGFMLLHNGLDWLAKVIRGVVPIHHGEQIERMNIHFRVAHWMVQLSFTSLVITGFALKYPESWWAAPIVAWEGTMPVRGWVHRVAAVVMLVALGYHIVHLAVRRRDRVVLRNLLPTMQDLRDMMAMFRYNLGLSSERPKFGMFSYGEKIEYLAFLWGTVVMSVTGFLLWFENFTLRNFPTWVVDASTALHWYEAVLATLAIVIWHLYGVIFDPEIYPMDKAWLTGKVPVEHLRHARPVYLAELLAGRAAAAPAVAAAVATVPAPAAAEAPAGDTTPPQPAPADRSSPPPGHS